MRVAVLGGVRSSISASPRHGVDKIVRGLVHQLHRMGFVVATNFGDSLSDPPALLASHCAPLPMPPVDAPLARLLTYNLDLLAALYNLDGPLVANVHDLRVVPAALMVRRLRPKMGLVASLAGTVHGRYGAESGTWLSYLAELEMRLVANADVIAVPGRAHAVEIARSFGVSAGRIVDVGIGIDLPAASPSDAERVASRLLYVGRLAREKGVLELVSAFRIVVAQRPDVELHVVGDGRLRGELETRVRDAGLDDRVVFTGWLSPEELQREYARAAVCVVPSRYDPYPAVVPEALANGCVVVGTRVGGIPELLGDGQWGVLVESPSADLLARATLDVLAAPNAHRERASNARTWIEETLSWTSFARRMVTTFGTSITRAGRHRGTSLGDHNELQP